MPAVRADNSLRTRLVKLLIMIMLDSGPFIRDVLFVPQCGQTIRYGPGR